METPGPNLLYVPGAAAQVELELFFVWGVFRGWVFFKQILSRKRWNSRKKHKKQRFFGGGIRNDVDFQISEIISWDELGW